MLPVSVTVTAPEIAKAGEEVLFKCVTQGSEPPASLVWKVGETVKTGTVSICLYQQLKLTLDFKIVDV